MHLQASHLLGEAKGRGRAVSADPASLSGGMTPSPVFSGCVQNPLLLPLLPFALGAPSSGPPDLWFGHWTLERLGYLRLPPASSLGGNSGRLSPVSGAASVSP